MRLLVCLLVVLGSTHAFADDAAPAPQAPSAFDTSSAVALLGKNIVVTLIDGGVTAGTLAEAGPQKIVIILANGQQLAVASSGITSIRLADTQPATPTPATAPSATTPTPQSTVAQPTESPFEREKREADQDRQARLAVARKEASDHASAATTWYLGAGGALLTAGAFLGGWLFLIASPCCLIGAGIGVLTAAGAGLVGIMESSAATNKEHEAQAMAY